MMSGLYLTKVKEVFLFSFVLFIAVQNVAGFDCEIVQGMGASTVSCPTILNSNDKKFCCYNDGGDSAVGYCCDIQDFVQMKWVIYTMVGIALGIFLGCCLCGCCCYRRRTRGAVYGRVQAIIVQQPIQGAPPNLPYNCAPEAFQQFPITGHHIPPAYGGGPSEVYSKQAPFNPHHY